MKELDTLKTENTIENTIENTEIQNYNNITNQNTNNTNKKNINEDNKIETSISQAVENEIITSQEAKTEVIIPNTVKEETNTIQEVKKDTSFKMTSIEITSSLTSNTEYYTLRGRANLQVGKDADCTKYSNFTTTINGEKVSSNGDTIYDGYMWFYESYNPLIEGENEFNIVVTDADGSTISKSVIVTYIPEDS